MVEGADSDVTRLLERSRDGDPAAREALAETVHQHLRSLASRLLAGERRDHTLQPTALVNEAWMRLVPRDVGSGPAGRDRGHFLAIAARAMRQVLVNHARDRGRLKRRGPEGAERLTLSMVAADRGGLPDLDVLDLHATLEALHDLDERQHAIVELRVFGGLTVRQTAEVLGVSARTVDLDWRMARAWLSGRLGDPAD